jgi:hypothetical protein
MTAPAKPAGSSSAEPRVTREQVWKQLGPPTDQVGSVNDPRMRDEHGVRWNEKWIYRGEDGRRVVRVVLWNRYDLLGVFRIAADGGATPEPLPE